MERDSEACIVAEGQPRNILAYISTRFAGCCRVGHLPGVGRSASNCCCVEKNADVQPEGKARIATPNNNSGQREGYQTRATTTTGYGNNQRGNRHNPMHMGHMARV